MTRQSWALARATALVLAVVLLSPVSPLALVCVPLAVLLLAFRSDNSLALALGVFLLAFVFVGIGEGPEPLWYAERAWALMLAGGFVLTSLLLAGRGVLVRGLGAVGVATSGLALFGVVRPGLLAELDWRVANELGRAAQLAYDVLGGAAWDRLGATVHDVVGVQALLYPAFLGLASLAALGVGWYVVGRLDGRREESLGPFREFRFSDQLIWVLIGGLLLFLLPMGEVAERLGENAMVFMGGLYLLRGIAILVWVGAALLTSAWTAMLWAAAALLLYPLVAGAALILGLSDTWLDVRRRLARAPADGGEA